MSQRIKAYFDTSQELRQLSHRVAQLLVLEQRYKKIVAPSLASASHVMQLEQQTLMIGADNSAVAAKLRQLAPNLIQQFQDGGHEVTGIQVRVQVALPPVTRHPSPARVSAAGKRRLTDLADKLAESPLKNALQRLAKGQK